MSSGSDALIDPRVRALDNNVPDAAGSCVIYVMSRDQRLQNNFALFVAQQQALRLKLPLIVVFCLQPKTGVRAREHYEFMLAGLRQVEKDLSALNIPFHICIGQPIHELLKVVRVYNPAAIYFDFSPLRGPLKLHQSIAEQPDKTAVYEVDAHNIVPVWVTSNKQEIGARTLRPKIMRRLGEWLGQGANIQTHPVSINQKVQSINDSKLNIDKLLKEIAANGTDISRFEPGEKAAQVALDDFLKNRLTGYATYRNDPLVDGQSELNPYLHYGQLASASVISAVEEAAQQDASLRADADALIEEMVVRKELSDNFCYYNPAYDSLTGAPDWAQKTLKKHAGDTRDVTYNLTQFEAAQTQDNAWNAAQMQLRQTGKIHGYMRMYWAKKVLEWSETPDAALKTLLYLNDHYHIDGGDPNGYVGILWSIAGLHDRPWFERPVYGQIRYMNANGLKRKFKIDDYINRYPATDSKTID